MKKYCNKHYGVYEDTEGCVYCPKIATKQVVKAFKMTEDRRWYNCEWPGWLGEAWNKNLTDPGCLYPSLDCTDPLGSLVLHTRKSSAELIPWGSYIICGDNGELAICDAETFESNYICEYNPYDLANN